MTYTKGGRSRSVDYVFFFKICHCHYNRKELSCVWGGTLLKLEDNKIYQTFCSLLLMVSADELCVLFIKQEHLTRGVVTQSKHVIQLSRELHSICQNEEVRAK